MKIVYIAPSLIPSRWANSFHVMKMCQAFRQLGHDIELILPDIGDHRQTADWIDIWHHYGITEKFPISRLGWSKQLKVGYDFAIRASQCAVARKPDLVFSRFIPAASLTARRGLPTILEHHAPVDSPFRREALRRLGAPGGFRQCILSTLEQMSFHRIIHGRGFRKLIVISQVLKDLFLECAKWGLGEDKILVCPDGVDLERFENLPQPVEARRQVGLPEDTPTFGYVGGLYEGFGIELILELARRLSRFNFLIVGGEDDHVAKYVGHAQALGVSNVWFVGFKPNAALPGYFAACDILLMPYQVGCVSVARVAPRAGEGNTARWMSPLKMFEYMATGRLIVSSDLPVLREVLNETNAVLCKPEDFDSWQQMAERAIMEPALRRALGEKARTDVAQYAWPRRAARILQGLNSSNSHPSGSAGSPDDSTCG